MAFDKLVPKIFSDVVIESLQCKNRNEQEDAIKKFTQFWKQTQAFYPGYMPFDKEQDDIIDGGYDQSKKKKYLALHAMINFLEDPNPTLRLSCKSWLS